MLERKNIDRVFQENLKDLEIDPSKKVWKNIEYSLKNPIIQEPRRRIFPLWQRLGGVAMILILFLAGGFWFNNQSSNGSINNEVSDVKKSKENIPNSSPLLESEGNIVEQPGVLAQNEREKVIKLSEETPIFVKKANANIILPSIEFFATIPTLNNKNSFENRLFVDNMNNEDALVSIYDAQAIKSETKPIDKKWSVGPTIAPVYYNTLQNGSPLNNNLTQNSKTSDNALSFGVKINYHLSKKFFLQSGVNKLELAYNTKDVNATLSSVKNASNNINTSRSGVILRSGNNNLANNLPEINSANKSNVSGDLNQSIEYFELPLEMKYSLYDKKVGLNLVGGISTYFLTNNSVSIVSQNSTINLGEANNLNSFNFSGNFGVDLDYKISKSWYLNIAPMFKYQFNTYSNSAGNFKPYYFGVYSGLNYRF